MSKTPFQVRWLPVWPAHRNEDGTYVARPTGEPELSTEHLWRTRRVEPTELRVGHFIALPSTMDHDAEGAVRRLPKPHEQAHAWEVAMVVRVPDASGILIASNGLRVRADTVRLVEGDDRTTVAVTGAPDRDCFTPELRIVSPSQPYADLAVGFAAAVVEPPTADGEGTYLGFRDGLTTRSHHAWKTRPAAPEDLRPGTVVFFAIVSRRTCDQLLTTNWTHTIVETAPAASTGKVGLKGSAARAVDELRVLIE